MGPIINFSLVKTLRVNNKITQLVSNQVGFEPRASALEPVSFVASQLIILWNRKDHLDSPSRVCAACACSSQGI